MTRKLKPFFAALLALLLALTCMVPLVHAENATPETASDAVQSFIDAVNALDRDAIIAASNAWGLASQAWQADPENEELAAALDEAIAAQDTATQPLYAAEDLYCELSEEEQQREDVQTAYTEEQTARYLQKFRAPEVFAQTPFGLLRMRTTPEQYQQLMNPTPPNFRQTPSR